MNRTVIILAIALFSVVLEAKDKEKITLIFDEKKNAYVEHSKSEYIYNAKGELIQENLFAWNVYNGSWNPTYRIFFEYDNGRLVRKLSKSYYAPTNEWKYDSKTEYSYANDTTVAIFMTYNNHIAKLSDWDNFRREITVIEKKRISYHKLYYWESDTGSYYLYEERLYKYDKKGNNIETRVSGFHTTEWDEHAVITYKYDKKRRPTETIHIDTAHKRAITFKYKHIYR